jgi:hypothetical protein
MAAVEKSRPYKKASVDTCRPIQRAQQKGIEAPTEGQGSTIRRRFVGPY